MLRSLWGSPLCLGRRDELGWGVGEWVVFAPGIWFG